MRLAVTNDKADQGVPGLLGRDQVAKPGNRNVASAFEGLSVAAQDAN